MANVSAMLHPDIHEIQADCHLSAASKERRSVEVTFRITYLIIVNEVTAYDCST